MSSINNFSPFFVAAELRRALNELPDDAVVDVTLVAFNDALTLMYGDYLSKNMNEFVLSRITHSIHQLRSVVAENNRRIPETRSLCSARCGAWLRK